MEISWNFVGPEKWEPCSSDLKKLLFRKFFQSFWKRGCFTQMIINPKNILQIQSFEKTSLF